MSNLKEENVTVLKQYDMGGRTWTVSKIKNGRIYLQSPGLSEQSIDWCRFQEWFKLGRITSHEKEA
jgi:hypothetical protein